MATFITIQFVKLEFENKSTLRRNKTNIYISMINASKASFQGELLDFTSSKKFDRSVLY